MSDWNKITDKEPELYAVFLIKIENKTTDNSYYSIGHYYTDDDGIAYIKDNDNHFSKETGFKFMTRFQEELQITHWKIFTKPKEEQDNE